MKRFLVLLVLLLAACIQNPTPTAYPAAVQAYPGVAFYPHLASPTPAPLQPQALAYPGPGGPYMPVIIRNGIPARPTATATLPAPTATSTRTPTATQGPPTETPDPGNLPAIPDGHFDNSQWWEYSDAWDGLIVPSATFEGLTWRPFENSMMMFWGGRDVTEIVSPVGERSLLISDPVEIPLDVPSFYFRVHLLLRSEERFCTPPIDSFRVYIGPETFRTDWPIDTNTDTLIGILPLCRDNNTWSYLPISVDFDLRAFRGQTIRVKLLVWIDSIDYSHALLDKAEFTTDPPAALQAFSVQSADAAAPVFITGDDLTADLNPDWDEFELPEK